MDIGFYGGLFHGLHKVLMGSRSLCLTRNDCGSEDSGKKGWWIGLKVEIQPQLIATS